MEDAPAVPQGSSLRHTHKQLAHDDTNNDYAQYQFGSHCLPLKVRAKIPEGEFLTALTPVVGTLLPFLAVSCLNATCCYQKKASYLDRWKILQKKAMWLTS